MDQGSISTSLHCETNIPRPTGSTKTCLGRILPAAGRVRSCWGTSHSQTGVFVPHPNFESDGWGPSSTASYQTKTATERTSGSSVSRTKPNATSLGAPVGDEQRAAVEPPSQASAFDIIGMSMLGCLHLAFDASLVSFPLWKRGGLKGLFFIDER